jgi:hypothetical protein
MEKKRNKSNGERTYSMTGRVPLMDLASWQDEGGDRQGVIWFASDWGGGRKINMSDGLRLYNLS